MAESRQTRRKRLREDAKTLDKLRQRVGNHIMFPELEAAHLAGDYKKASEILKRITGSDKDDFAFFVAG